MKKNQIQKELAAKSAAELKTELDALLKEQFGLRMQKATQQLTNTGKLKLSFKRPSQLYPALGLTENIELTALLSSDKPGTSDRLILWISSPVTTTSDEGAGPRLKLSEESSGDEEGGEPKDDNGSVAALAREFKGQRWDADKSMWK